MKYCGKYSRLHGGIFLAYVAAFFICLLTNRRAICLLIGNRCPISLGALCGRRELILLWVWNKSRWGNMFVVVV